MNIRNKIKDLLILLANKIGDKTYYDFGDKIISMLEFENRLYIATKSNMFMLKNSKSKNKKQKFEKIKLDDK